MSINGLPACLPACPIWLESRLIPLAIEAESSEQCTLGTLLALTLAAAYVRDLARSPSEAEDRSTPGNRRALASQLINSTSGLMLLKGAAVAIQYASAVSCNSPLIDSVEQTLASSLQAMPRDIFYDYLQKGESVFFFLLWRRFSKILPTRV